MGFCLERWWWWVCREWPQAEVGDVLAGVAAAASWSWSWSWGAEYGAGGLCCGRWWAGGVDLASSPWGGSAQLQHGHEYGKHPGQPGEGQLLEKHFGLFFVFPLAGLDEGWISSVHGKFISNTWHRICLLPAWARHHTTQCQGTSWQVSFRRDGLHGRASLGASLLMPSRAGLAIQLALHGLVRRRSTSRPPNRHLPVPWTAMNSDLSRTLARLLSCLMAFRSSSGTDMTGLAVGTVKLSPISLPVVGRLSQEH